MSTSTEQINLFEEYYTHQCIKCYKCGHIQYVRKKQNRKTCRNCHYNIEISRCIIFGKTANREKVKEDKKNFDEKEKIFRVVKCPNCFFHQTVQAQWKVKTCLGKNCRNQFDLRRAEIVFETKNYDCALELAKLENE